jgi:hypothetical protein
VSDTKILLFINGNPTKGAMRMFLRFLLLWDFGCLPERWDLASP